MNKQLLKLFEKNAKLFIEAAIKSIVIEYSENKVINRQFFLTNKRKL